MEIHSDTTNYKILNFDFVQFSKDVFKKIHNSFSIHFSMANLRTLVNRMQMLNIFDRLATAGINDFRPQNKNAVESGDLLKLAPDSNSIRTLKGFYSLLSFHRPLVFKSHLFSLQEVTYLINTI